MREYNFISKVNCSSFFLSINWALMNKCNYKCSYCHPDLNSGSINAPPYEVVVQFVENISSDAKKLGLTPYFEFGGGEVTLLRYFSKLIQLIHENGGLVCIVSNGSKSLSWWRENAEYLNGVSLSYHVNDIKDENHLIEVAKTLESSKNTRLHVNVMMDPQKFNDCYSYAQRLKEQVKCSIALQPLFEGFGHGGITQKYNYTDKQESLMKSFRGWPDEKNLPEPRSFLDIEYIDGLKGTVSTFDLLINDQVNFIGWDCYAGVESIVITFAGEIYRAWCMQDGSIGSIYDTEIILPVKPTRCRTKICQCGADLSSTKINKRLIEQLDNSIAVTQIL
ncbi:radical SAM protein [Photobacterium kishitanii]|uniref:radical SAM protein n=1 Tax=Photobacterium kishitanii TaxID=318456 RepID=UPI000D16384F|nr:radical SAM protein [Photobacterium kishitanii]PSU90733.1 radical SAM protein [Photobacterium kishitanii]